MEASPEQTPQEKSSSTAGSGVFSQDVLPVKALLNTRQNTLRVKGQYEFEDLKSDGPITGDWDIKKEVAGFFVHGSISGSLLLECARCLEIFSVPLDVEVNERYVLNDYVDPYERERELQAEDFYEVLDEEGELDLKDLAHQWAILESENQSTCGRPECHFNQD